jgi:hypothetical protein
VQSATASKSVTVGVPFTWTMGLSPDSPAMINGAASFSSTALPSGVTLNAATGIISGTVPAGSSSRVVTVTATNPAGNATCVVTFTVAAAGDAVSGVGSGHADVTAGNAPQTSPADAGAGGCGSGGALAAVLGLLLIGRRRRG